MSKMKLALDVVQDLRNLADSIEALANATGEAPGDPVPTAPYDSAAPATPGGPMPDSSVPATPGGSMPGSSVPATPGGSMPGSSVPATPTEPKLTLVELRAYVAGRSTPENRPKIKAILGKHGVNKLTELPEDQYEALMREVAAL